jgi:HEPN domain-containing protein
MISSAELRKIARARFLDATALLRAKRYDGAYYLSGYSIELALKARICRTLKWPDFPESAQDFKGFQSIKTHDLEVLLRFSGIENRIKQKYMLEWSVVLDWNHEKRYQPVGQSSVQQATNMLTCAKRLLTVI